MLSRLLLFVLVFIVLNSKAQVIVFHEDVKADSIAVRYGANYKHFFQVLYAYGLVLGKATSGGAIKQPQSFFIDAGLQYKRKISNYYALIFNTAYHLQNFSLKQNKDKVIPDNVLHNKEKLLFNSIALSVLNRFNFNRRGNVIGDYLDAGMYAGWVFRTTNVVYDKSTNYDFSNGKTVTRHKGLAFTNNYNYGLMLRLGHNALGLIGYYRLSDLFKVAPLKAYPELPRLMLGFEISTM